MAFLANALREIKDDVVERETILGWKNFNIQKVLLKS